MNRFQFTHTSFKHSEELIYHQRHPNVDVRMMLLGVDFDNGVFKLAPFDIMSYEDEAIWVNYEFVDKPLSVKLKK